METGCLIITIQISINGTLIFRFCLPGSVFGTTACYCGGTGAGVGSRLCFESEEKAVHAGENFTKLFEEFITAKY
jgi:hypothetical protein